jgi:anaerobic selenocysteine-containing dehydrogenase
MEIVKSVCSMCHQLCGLDVHVDNGKIVKITPMQEHPFNKLCEKGYALPELVHSPERLTQPLRKVNGRFKEVSWDEALDSIAGKLTDIREKYGAKALVVHLGFAFVRSYVQYVTRRFCDLYGTPNYTSGGSICFVARVIAYNLTCGTFLNPHYSPETKCTVVWGNNPVESNVPPHPDSIYDAVRHGAKLIVVDPIATELAKKADIHAQLRPGTDCALALGLLNVIITEGLYDKDFVKEWTVGFDELAQYVKEYPPKKVEEITWVSAETIRQIARMYATSKPANITLYVAMDHSTNGIQAIRAIATLMGVTGNIDVPGGNTYTSVTRFNRLMTNLRLPERVAPDPGVGAAYPIFTKVVGETSSIPLTEQMLSGQPYPIKALLIAGNNAALTWPDTNKLRRGRKQLDLMVVIDIFMTDTAQMADIVLPGTSFLERPEIRDYLGRGVSLVTLGNKAIEPMGNSMEDWRIWAELGKRMGYAEFFPWKDTEELLNYLLKPSPISLEQLKQKPGGIFYAEREFKKYLKGGFSTPSKKFEIYSATLKEYGYDPLPAFHEPAESLVSRPDLAEKYPLVFLSGKKTRVYTHSQCRNLPSLRKLVPEPWLEIHPKTAHDLSISDGDWVRVESPRGSIKVKAKLTVDVHPKIVAMLYGWSEANANCLTDDMARDPISGFPGLRSVLCRVTKAAQ